MKFNWIIGQETDEKLHRFCIELEYRLRPRITKFLISRLDLESWADFTCFHFDIDLATKCVTLSDSTPRHYLQQIKSDFESEIGQNCC